MDAQIMLGRILQQFIDSQIAQAEGLQSFEFVSYTNSSVTVLREKGTEALIPFKKLWVE